MRAAGFALLGLGVAACNEATLTSGTPAPTLTFSSNPTVVSAGGSAMLNWNSADATACTASGGWSGNVATSGSRNTGALTTTTTYTLSCSSPGGTTSRSVMVQVQAPATGSTTLSWIAPTTNEDSSPLTDLAGFNIYHGTSAASLQRIASTTAASQTYTVSNLGPGTHYFAVTATNVAGAESARSNVVSWTIP